MTLPDKLPNGAKTVAAPALARLLADSALSRAALAACGFPLALADAGAKGRPSADVELSIGMVHGVEGLLTHWVLAFADRGEIARMQEELRVLRAISAAP